MGKSRILTSSLVFFLSVSMTARADEAAAVHEYSVQLGETLSEIAQRLFGNPVYPKGGALEKILALNPQIQDANFIRFGQVLRVDGAPNRTLASGEREEVMASSNRNFESGRDVASESTEPSRAVASESPEAMTSSFSELEFAPDFRFVKLEAKDRQTGANATLVSDKYFGFRGAWIQRWNAAFATYQWFSYSKTTFAEPIQKTLETKDFTAQTFGIGARFFQDMRHRLSVGIGVEKTPYIRATSLTSVRFDPIVTPVLKLQSDHDLLHSEPFRAGANLFAEGRGSGSNDTIKAKAGYGLGVGFFVEQQFKSSRFRIMTSYMHEKQDSSIATQTRDQIGFELNYTLRLGTTESK